LAFELFMGKREIFCMRCKLLLSLLPVSLITLCTPQIASAQELTLAQCPAVVQSAIRSNGQGGSLEEIKLVNRDGATLYVAELGLGEKRDLKMYIAPDGTIVKSRQEIDFKQAPAPVRRTVLGLMPAGAVVNDVDMETAEGTTTFVVEVKVTPTRELKIIMQADGSVLSEHEEEKN
jgi:uncharacterized membrane protein YkoI